MKDIITAVLLPPGIAVICGLLSLYFLRRKFRFARLMLVISVILGWALSTEAMGRVLATGLISQVRGQENVDINNIDMIVVLTGGMTYAGDVGWLPKPDSYRRGLVAFELQNRIGSRTPILISGGRTEGLKHPSEAQVLARQFDRHSAQLTPVELEESSTNTYENALQSAAMLQNRDAKNVVLVTSEVHMLRALAAFRGRGIDPVPIPVLTINRGEHTFRDFLPSRDGLVATHNAMYEIYGLVEYLWSGYIRVDDILYSK